MESPTANTREKNVKSRVAAYWYVKAHGNTLTRADRKRFIAWLKRSPGNVAALITILDVQNHVCAEWSSKRAAEWSSKPVELFRALSQSTAQLETVTPRAASLRAANDLLGLALSSTYLAHFQRANLPAKLALGGLSLLTILAALVLNVPGALPAAGISIAFLATVAVHEAVVGYRISHGLFGSTAAEARLLLRFLIKNSRTIDFDDRNGKPRPVFEPSAQPSERKRIPVGAVTE